MRPLINLLKVLTLLKYTDDTLSIGKECYYANLCIWIVLDGLSAGTFIVMTNHNERMESVYVLNEYKVTLKQHASLQPNNSENGKFAGEKNQVI